MKNFVGHMTVRIKGMTAADAVQRLINPNIPGTEAEITAMSVAEEQPYIDVPIQWTEQPEPHQLRH
jgi:hypothetical protein